jgi:Protein of unknown function (DUF2924)
MNLNIATEVAALKRMPLDDLREKYGAVFGEATRNGNRVWLVKRIAWRLQALAEGDLSQRARQRAAAIANDADLRLTPPGPPRPVSPTSAPSRRLPMPGAVLTRVYKGATLQVKVLTKGFEFEDKIYTSLSAVAQAISGSHCNGFLFFKIAKKGASR